MFQSALLQVLALLAMWLSQTTSAVLVTSRQSDSAPTVKIKDGSYFGSHNTYNRDVFLGISYSHLQLAIFDSDKLNP